MSPVLPEAASLKTVVTALNALDARVSALEATATENRLALRAILTVLHPDPGHIAESPAVLDLTKPQTDPRVQAEAIHHLLMDWIERLGGRLPLL